MVLLPPALKFGVDSLNSALGITPSQSGSAAKGAGHHPWQGATTPPPVSESWKHWWDRETAGTPQSGSSARGAGHLQHSSYTGQATIVPVTLQVDGQTVARIVTKHQERAAERTPLTGINSFDGRQSMTPPGMITA